MPSAVVLVIDGLGAGHVGPYGNTWIDTPAFNCLATESLLAERAWSTFPTPEDCYQALWRGANAFGCPAAPFAESSLLNLLDQRGVATKLCTDDPTLIDHRWASGFSEQIELEAGQPVKIAAAQAYRPRREELRQDR